MKKIFLLSITLVLTLSLISCTKKEQDKSFESMYKDDSETQEEEIEKLLDDNQKTMPKSEQTKIPKTGEEIAVITTNKGVIKIKFFSDIAPKTVKNFKKLSNEKFYNGLIFHRVIDGFMIQGGDPDKNGTGGPGYTIPAEFSSKLSHIPGAVSTARLGDQVNPKKDSSGSQFFMVHKDSEFLDNEYTIFGQIIEGMDVVNDIANVETDVRDKPIEDVKMEKVEITTYK